MPCTEETFFAALRDHLPHYTLTISKSDRCPSEPYAVEIFAREQSYRCKGFTPSECFDNLLRAMAITPRAGYRTSRTPAPPLDASAPAPESKTGKTSPG